MNPKIIEKEAIMLAGFGFFGDPFKTKDPWSEDNEIGKLWHRYMAFIHQHIFLKNHNNSKSSAYYEIHINHHETNKTGEFEVFLGTEIKQIEGLPVELIAKVLPPAMYAIFTMEGVQINQDWPQMIYQKWMPKSGYKSAYSFNFQYYDHRFKGMDKLSESAIDVYVPIKKTVQ
jgi:predicted transcriptional regulator YdeE